jgi:hypothetical protein
MSKEPGFIRSKAEQKEPDSTQNKYMLELKVIALLFPFLDLTCLLSLINFYNELKFLTSR